MENVYVGARYVPKFADPAEHDSTKAYEPLIIVTSQGASYTSKTYVPAGVALTDTDYWVVTGNYNAQVEAYRQEVVTLKATLESKFNDLCVNVLYPPSSLTPAVGDGITDDTSAINAIISYVESIGGGTVLIPNGHTFIFTSIHVGTGVRLFSNGGVLKLKDNTCVSASTSYYLIENMGESKSMFDGLIINGNASKNTAFLVADGITAGGENTVVSNCYLYDIPDSGIMFSGGVNAIVYNNRINNTRDCGIYVNDGTGNNAKNNIISFNRITNAVTSGIALKRYCNKFTVISNVISDCGFGVTLEQASTTTDYSFNIDVTNNRISNVTVGVNLRVSPNCVITSNRIENFTQCGVVIEGNTYNCTINSNVLNSTLAPSDGYSYRSGISMFSRDNIAPHNNVISANSFVATTTSYTAVYCATLETVNSGGNYNVITSNQFNTLGSYGIRLSSGFTKTNITGNYCCGTELDIYLNGSVGNIITNNMLVHNTSDDASANLTIVSVLGTRRVIVADGQPASGNYNMGDMVLKRTQTSGNALGWVCVTSGNPGTWVRMANNLTTN